VGPLFHFFEMSPALDQTPSWDALRWVVAHNTRDVIERRFDLYPEVVAWFKALSMFRETERDVMILKDPSDDDRSAHKSVLALLIADGERLKGRLTRAGGLEPNHSGITTADFQAALNHLYDSQAVCHGDMTESRKEEILRALHGAISGT
jgi:hypothetical protein